MVSQMSAREGTGIAGGRMTVRTLKRDSMWECWLTGVPRQELPVERAAEELFGSIASKLSECAIQPIQEKIYGTISCREAVLSARAAAYRAAGLDPLLPFTYLEGCPPGGGSLAGVQLWGVTSQADEPAVVTVGHGSRACGRVFSGPGFKALYLPAVSGTMPDGQLAGSAAEQAERMFINAESALSAHGMSYQDVIRTWIYLPHILDWYGEFNRVRTSFYKKHGIGDEKAGHIFPASTGIQASPGVQECIIDLLAIKCEPGSPLDVKPLLGSRRQDRAFKYGSAFSRGMSVSWGGGQTVFVSGTASIGPDGQTRYVQLPEAQIMETLLSIAALLEPVGGALADICSATLFCKDPSIYQAFKEVTELLGVPDFPVIPVLADVCRSELLVEIEAMATPANRDLSAAFSPAGGHVHEGLRS